MYDKLQEIEEKEMNRGNKINWKIFYVVLFEFTLESRLIIPD